MCTDADWKREKVESHKWDYVDVREYHNPSILTRIRYCLVYLFVLKNVAIYGLDIFTAATMLKTDNWTNALYTKCSKSGTGKCDVDVKFGIAKWVFVGCIIFSFLLLGYEVWKARQVIQSRDIAYAFTNLMANDYYSLKKYDNFCLFCKISKQNKKKDKLAFFIFFTFKDWKRVIVCDGPRQCINAIILWTILKAYNFETRDISQYWDGNPWTLMLLLSMITTVLIFLISFGLMIVAAVFYIPLLCYIQGNLKEYVCHKVDKRIDHIFRKYHARNIKRNAEMEKKLAAGVSNGVYDADLIQQPTLPSISLEDTKLPVRSASPAPYGRSASPAFNRSASPGFGRTASPAFGRSASPAPGGRPVSPAYGHSLAPGPPPTYAQQHHLAPDHDMEKAYPPSIDDIYDAYSTDDQSNSGHGSAKVGLLSAAAPPGRSPAPLHGAPSYPPRAAPGAPSYPPSQTQRHLAGPNQYAQRGYGQAHGW